MDTQVLESQVTTAPDTVPGQLVHPELGMPLTGVGEVEVYSSDMLSIPRRLLKKLWREGFIDNTSYAIFAMYCDGIGKDSGLTKFNMNDFAVKWSEHWQVDKEVKGKKGGPDTIEVVDKQKQLTETQIETALGKFEKKEKATVQRDIQLNISWGDM